MDKWNTTSAFSQALASAFLVIAALLLTPRLAQADGVIIPDPPPDPVPGENGPDWLTIRYHHVDVIIDGQIAVTRVEQEFINEKDWEVEGTYLFPLPKGAAISEFTMWVEGERVEGKILEAEEARQVYEDIVRRRRDPALLEYVGRDAVQVRIYPIPAGGTRKVELAYTQVLENEGGMVEYIYPLSTEKYSARPLETCSIHVEIDAGQPIHAIYSPTHHDRVFLDRTEGDRARVSYEETGVLPEEDFELIYTVEERDIGLHILPYINQEGSVSGEEGYFLLLASPQMEVDRVIPRDLVFVLDTSGSMEGKKLSQAKSALTYVLEHLNEGDRFNVIAFSSGIERFADQLQPASAAPSAASWLESLEALGGTDINWGLTEAFSSLERGKEGQGGSARPAVVIFLTDGLPTEGVTDVQEILARARKEADPRLRLFPFGVGDDVNTILLDTLAEDHHGYTAYVRPQENIEAEVSGLYAKIKSPVLTDLKIDFGEVVAEDLYPRSLPDLYAGTQLILAGRYRLPSGRDQMTEIVLSGNVDGREKEYVYPVNFPGQGTTWSQVREARSYIPRLWATRKIGYFMTQIRLHGEKDEWVQAVVDLSVRYGIITPYTSFLIDEEDILTQRGQEEAARELSAQPSLPASGRAAAEKAEIEGQMRAADSVPSQPGGQGSSGEEERTLKYAGSKTFLRSGGIWTDTTFDPQTMETVKIGFGTETYFQILASRPAWGKYFSLGKEVIFIAEGKAYQVVKGPGEDIEVPTHEQGQTPSVPEPPVQSFSDFPGFLCPGSLIWGFVIWGWVVIKKR